MNVGLTLAQIIGGIVSGSLPLIADALHNLNDAASLGIALFARRIARRPVNKHRPSATAGLRLSRPLSIL